VLANRVFILLSTSVHTGIFFLGWDDRSGLKQ